MKSKNFYTDTQIFASRIPTYVWCCWRTYFHKNCGNIFFSRQIEDSPSPMLDIIIVQKLAFIAVIHNMQCWSVSYCADLTFCVAKWYTAASCPFLHTWAQFRLVLGGSYSVNYAGGIRYLVQTPLFITNNNFNLIPFHFQALTGQKCIIFLNFFNYV